MKRRIIASWIINAISFFIVSQIVAGMQFENFVSILLAGIVLGIVNATLKPLFIVISLPISVLTLGLFLIIINAIMLEIVVAIVPGFSLVSFWTAIWGSILLSIVSMIIMHVLFPRRRTA
ncbi:MAG: phage holin family protein [Caldisericota bacterium]|nr:phage holin family protein [Caldisericota bacterium]